MIVFINTYTIKFQYPCLLATTKAFVGQAGSTSLCEVIPCHYDNASCFNASQLSINKCVADFPQYTFSEAAILPESPDCQPRVY